MQSAFSAKCGGVWRVGRGENCSNWLCGRAMLPMRQVSLTSISQFAPATSLTRTRARLPQISSQHGAASPLPHLSLHQPMHPWLYPLLWLIGNQPKLVTIEIAFGQRIMINKSMKAFDGITACRVSSYVEYCIELCFEGDAMISDCRLTC